MNLRSLTRSRRGFTAIELTAVATIIAILALILLPIVRSRLETVRINAALDDMRSIEVAEVLANADTGFYFRLSDLDNPKADVDTFKNPASTNVQRADAVRTVPNGTWNRVFNTTTEQSNQGTLGSVAANWNGPYITYNRTKFIALTDVVAGVTNNSPYRVLNIDTNPPTNLAGLGPIPIFRSAASANTDPFNDDIANGEVTPVDSWGGPYIFFGPGRFGRTAGQTALSTGTGARNAEDESNFGTSAVYSLGPDTLPGNKVNPTALDYYRDNSQVTPPIGTVLGTGDDLVRVF